MSALEWLPLMYPQGLLDMRDKDSNPSRRLNNLPPSMLTPHPMHPHSHHHHHLPHHPLPGLLPPKPGALYHPAAAGFLRSMSVAVGEPAPHLPSSPFPSNLFMGAALNGSSSESRTPNNKELLMPFDLSKRFHNNGISAGKGHHHQQQNHHQSVQNHHNRRAVGEEEGEAKIPSKEQSAGGVVSSKDEQPLDLSVKRRKRLDENQNVISTCTPSPPPKKRSRSPTPVSSHQQHHNHHHPRPESSPTPPAAKRIHTPISIANGGGRQTPGNNNEQTETTLSNNSSSSSNNNGATFTPPTMNHPAMNMFGRHHLPPHGLRHASPHHPGGGGGRPFPFVASALNPQFVQQPYHDVIGKHWLFFFSFTLNCQFNKIISFVFVGTGQTGSGGISKSRDRYCCKYCGKVFKSKYVLINHTRSINNLSF